MSVPRTHLDEVFQALRQDLIHEDGPRISTMRNYRFAIVPYRPENEFKLREHTARLVRDLEDADWIVRTLSLHKLLMRRLHGLGENILQRIAAMERQTHQRAPERARNYLRQKIQPLIHGPEGIAADVVAEIQQIADQHPERAERTLVLIGRAGALYPYFRYSALLKFLDGKTRQIPVILLYPGVRRSDSGLSFMGRLSADRDYRPRIYGAISNP